jgi:hypothetical protein
MTPTDTPASCAQNAPPRRRHALGRRTDEPDADLLARRAEFAHAQAHAQHHAPRAQRVFGDPIDEHAEFWLERRIVELEHNVLHPVVQPGLDGDVVGPDHADRLPRPERHGDDIAGLQRKLRRHLVRIGVVEGDRHQDIDERRSHAAGLADSGRLRKGEGRG